jgi:hypothetical protein
MRLSRATAALPKIILELPYVLTFFGGRAHHVDVQESHHFLQLPQLEVGVVCLFAQVHLLEHDRMNRTGSSM